MKKTVLFICALVITAAVNAQTCNENITPTTPDGRFYDNGDGTVKDRQTGLIWMRCALGQSWDGQTCAGNAIKYTWQQALQRANNFEYAGSSDWRVSDIKQLKSIIELACYGPAINLNIFPQTPSSWFWTASPDANYYYTEAYAWHVRFSNGDYDYSNKSRDNKYVRLVRLDSD